MGDTVVTNKHFATTFVAAAAIIVAGTLSGCGSPAGPTDIPAGDYPDLTLAESKAPAQVLRNTAVTRIPEATVLNVGTQTDGSVSCLSEKDDPNGYIRQWISSVDVNLILTEAPNAQAIVDGLLATFTDEGWMSQQITGSAADKHAHMLTNATAEGAGVSDAKVRVEAVVANDGKSSFIHIDALGPCVITDGATSSEVVNLGKL